MELYKELELANNQFDIRVERLKKLYSLNAIPGIIFNELKLIKEAGERICVLTSILNNEKKPDEYQGYTIIKKALEHQEIEELNEKMENDFSELKQIILTDMKVIYPTDILLEEKVEVIFDELKEKSFIVSKKDL